ncbi:MAG: O-antigen ligase family protein [Actinomycetota bacterium]
MTVVAFALVVAVGVGWLVVTARGAGSAPDRALQVAWQLAAASFLSAPEELVGEQGEIALQVGLGALAALAVGVRFVLQGREHWSVAVTPWLAVYGVVLAGSAVFSSSPEVAALRGLRAVVLLLVFGQAAAWLDRAVLRRLFLQLTAGLAVVVAIGPVVAGGDAFHPLRAPVIRWALQAPVIGSGPHVVAAIGFGLALATAWCWFDGDRPVVGTRAWFLRVAGPGSAGALLVLASQKRAFWLAIAVAALTWLVLRHRRWLVPAVAAVAVVGVSFLAVGPLRELWDREQSRPQIDNIASVRGAIFDASLDRFRERPIIGDGLGVGNRDLLIDVGQEGLGWSSHSEVGAALAATGLLGLAVLAWAHVHGGRGAVAAWRERADPMALVALTASLALLPFWRVLQEPLVVGLAYYTLVFPIHDWRRRGPGATSAPPTAGVEVGR